MSRLGKQPVTLPENVDVTFAERVLTVKGPKGSISRAVLPLIIVTVEGKTVTFAKAKETKSSRALWGTYASHLINMIEGVTKGFEKKLEIEGVGYKSEIQGSKIKLSVGFSHPVFLEAPVGVEMKSEQGVITISGIDKEVVGQFAADIRATKPPEPYKGKGIHYVGEYIIRKQGKKGVA